LYDDDDDDDDDVCIDYLKWPFFVWSFLYKIYFPTKYIFFFFIQGKKKKKFKN